MGLCLGQSGERRDDVDGEGSGGRLNHGGDPHSRRSHVSIWMPLPASGRPVLGPRLVRVHVKTPSRQTEQGNVETQTHEGTTLMAEEHRVI